MGKLNRARHRVSKMDKELSKAYEEYMQDYPLVEPCIYCKYWKTLGKFPCCHYLFDTGELRGDNDLCYTGECSKFSPRKAKVSE